MATTFFGKTSIQTHKEEFSLSSVKNELVALREEDLSDPGGGTSPIKRAGMLVGKFQMNPYRVPI